MDNAACSLSNKLLAGLTLTFCWLLSSTNESGQLEVMAMPVVNEPSSDRMRPFFPQRSDKTANGKDINNTPSQSLPDNPALQPCQEISGPERVATLPGAAKRNAIHLLVSGPNAYELQKSHIIGQILPFLLMNFSHKIHDDVFFFIGWIEYEIITTDNSSFQLITAVRDPSSPSTYLTLQMPESEEEVSELLRLEVSALAGMDPSIATHQSSDSSKRTFLRATIITGGAFLIFIVGAAIISAIQWHQTPAPKLHGLTTSHLNSGEAHEKSQAYTTQLRTGSMPQAGAWTSFPSNFKAKENAVFRSLHSPTQPGIYNVPGLEANWDNMCEGSQYITFLKQAQAVYEEPVLLDDDNSGEEQCVEIGSPAAPLSKEGYDSTNIYDNVASPPDYDEYRGDRYHHVPSINN